MAMINSKANSRVEENSDLDKRLFDYHLNKYVA